MTTSVGVISEVGHVIDRWSAADILKKQRKLGVPHFQRGLVWGGDSVSLLLESLFCGTPCGELLLWRPEDSSQQGIPLPGASKPSLLILDGQQRIRSICQALGQDGKVTTDGEEEDEEASERYWCLNLARVEGAFDGEKFGDAAKFPLFRLIRHPIRDEKAQIKHDHVPLDVLFSSVEVPKELFGDPSRAERLLHLLEEHAIRERVQAMRRLTLFSVRILEQEGRRLDLPEVVALYNRINSGGRRVESEEVAFATIVAMQPVTGPWLKDVFKDIHGADASESTAVVQDPYALERDDAMRRRKERAFGFKMIVRTFIQVCAYHFGYSLGSNVISFDVVASPTFRGDLAREKARIGLLRDRTRGVLVYLRDILAEDLGCDDLQMLPETTSLLPVVQLLIRFPGVMGEKHCRPIVASLLLRLLLRPRPTQRAVLDLVEAVNRAHTAEQCFREMSGTLKPHLSAAELEKELRNADSLQDRFVLLLYWWMTGHEARNLKYSQLEALMNKDGTTRRQSMLRKYGKKYEQEVLLSRSAEPEKQHLVPYSELRTLLGIRSRGRISKHPANNIGNITYLSHAMNHFETGLGGEAANLDVEPLQNLQRHLLAHDDGTTLVPPYAEACRRSGAAGARKRAFKRFCAARRQLIAEAFATWPEQVAGGATLRRRNRAGHSAAAEGGRLHPPPGFLRCCGGRPPSVCPDSGTQVLGEEVKDPEDDCILRS